MGHKPNPRQKSHVTVATTGASPPKEAVVRRAAAVGHANGIADMSAVTKCDLRLSSHQLHSAAHLLNLPLRQLRHEASAHLQRSAAVVQYQTTTQAISLRG